MKAVLKITIAIFLILPLTVNKATAQDVGLSFSFFFPKNGEFSTPISPFSFRGAGFNLNQYIGVESGFTLYRMAGMNVKDLPFESEKPILGPNFTLFIPLELVLTAPFSQAEFSIKGGGFGFYSFGNKINHGHLDRAIAADKGYQLVNSEYEGENKAGFGFHFGGEIMLYVFQNFGLSLEANYLIGGADFPMSGSYTALDENNQIIEVTDADAAFPDARIDMTGLELSIGVTMQTGGGKNPPRRRRR
jgi:hypothetical protein